MRDIIRIVLLTLVITGGESASPKLGFCLEENRIAWMSVTPYVEKQRSTSNYTGILTEVFKTGMRACCRGNLNYNFTVNFNSQEEVMDIPYLHTVDFIMPVQKLLKSKPFQHFPFISLVESPGLAFYVAHDTCGGKTLIRAVASVTPLVILMFLLVSISGTFFWICESMALAWLGRKPQSFIRGVLSGFWWAFVSMTTVGYGDIIPKTKPSKLFSLLWVLIGVAFCALFTSTITTMLTLSLINKHVSLPGMEIAVLKGSEEYKYALKKQALPLVFDNIEAIAEAIVQKKVSAALLDAYVAAEYKEKLDNLHLQTIIEHVSTNGVIFQNNGFRYVKCIRDYVLSRQTDIFDMISKRVKTLTVHSDNIETSIIDVENPSFYKPVYSMLGTLVVVCAYGSLREWILKKRAGDGTECLEELTLTQWRREYKVQLSQTMREIRNDADKIKLKSHVIMEKLDDGFSGLANMTSSGGNEVF